MKDICQVWVLNQEGTLLNELLCNVYKSMMQGILCKDFFFGAKQYVRKHIEKILTQL